MSENRFSIWHIIGLCVIAASLAVFALGSGLFLGYELGRASSLSASVANRAQSATAVIASQTDQLPLQLAANHPYLGLEYETLTPQLAQRYNLAIQDGALIRSITSHSPADSAGLQVGDIIQKVNDQPLTSALTLPDAIDVYKPETEITLTVWRAGTTAAYKVTLGSAHEGQISSLPLNELEPNLRTLTPSPSH